MERWAYLHRHITEGSCRLAGRCNEGRRLIEGLVQVLLQRDVGVKVILLLTNLSTGKICYHLTDQLDHLQQAGQRLQYDLAVSSFISQGCNQNTVSVLES